jgi:hypothetical protein
MVTKKNHVCSNFGIVSKKETVLVKSSVPSVEFRPNLAWALSINIFRLGLINPKDFQNLVENFIFVILLRNEPQIGRRPINGDFIFVFNCVYK